MAGRHNIELRVKDSTGSWSLPATAVLVVSACTTDVIVDNGKAGTSFTGNWLKSTAAGCYGADSSYSPYGRSASLPVPTYSFQASVPSGSYEVFEWHSVYATRTKAAVHRINHASGQASVTVDQSVGGGKWNSLGTYTFGSTAKVTVLANDLLKSTNADAVRFVCRSSEPPPSLETIVDNGKAGTSSVGTWASSGGPSPYGGSSLYSSAAGAKYTFQAAVTGSAKVSLWWTTWPSRCTAVSVQIYSGSTLLDTVKVNQQANGGKWNVLGTYTFGGTAKVVLLSAGGCTTCADAARFSSPALQLLVLDEDEEAQLEEGAVVPDAFFLRGDANADREVEYLRRHLAPRLPVPRRRGARLPQCGGRGRPGRRDGARRGGDPRSPLPGRLERAGALPGLRGGPERGPPRCQTYPSCE